MKQNSASVAPEVMYESLFEADKVWYTSKEAARLLGMSAQFVRDALESQELMGHEVSSRGPHARRVKLVHRDCLAVYLAQTANYTPKDFVDKLKKLLLRRTAAERQEIRAWLDKIGVMGRPGAVYVSAAAKKFPVAVRALQAARRN